MSCGFLRYVAQGKGILQPHTLIDELDNVIGDEQARLRLRDGPFSEVLKSAMVIFPHLSPLPSFYLYFFKDIVNFYIEKEKKKHVYIFIYFSSAIHDRVIEFIIYYKNVFVVRNFLG